MQLPMNELNNTNLILSCIAF